MGFDPTRHVRLELEAGESLIKEGPANQVKGLEAVGGRLFLTTRRLAFRSHAFDMQVHEVSYPLAEIGAVEPPRTFGFIPNGLKVEVGGTKHRFVVGNRAEWVRVIHKARLRAQRS